MNKKIVLIAITLAALAIVLGAFGAHGLKDLVSAEKVASFETGVKYQMYAALSLMLVAFNDDKFSASPTWFYRLLITGALLFSCSIYLLSLQEVIDVKLKFLGPITPLAGLIMICAWVALFVNLLSNSKK